MRVRRNNSDGDWTMGRGRADYLRDSNAIRQNVVTRLRSFTDDWFANVDHGVPWIDVFGSVNPDDRERIRREIERTVLNTEGVRSIDRLRVVEVDNNRRARVELTYRDIFDERPAQIVEVP